MPLALPSSTRADDIKTDINHQEKLEILELLKFTKILNHHYPSLPTAPFPFTVLLPDIDAWAHAYSIPVLWKSDAFTSKCFRLPANLPSSWILSCFWFVYESASFSCYEHVRWMEALFRKFQLRLKFLRKLYHLVLYLTFFYWNYKVQSFFRCLWAFSPCK